MKNMKRPEHSPNENMGISKWLVGISVLYVITGIMMLIWPHLTLSMLGNVLGIGLLVVGAANIIIYLTRDHLDGILQLDLTEGVIFAAFGAFMLLHADFVHMALPFGTGILLLVGGISHIQYALDMRRLFFVHWKIMLIFAVILIVLGSVLIYNPFSATILIYFMGCSLILNGGLSIFSVLAISHRMKKIKAGKLPAAFVRGHNKNGEDIFDPESVHEDIFDPKTVHEEVSQPPAPK